MVGITVDFYEKEDIMCERFEDGDIIGFSDDIDGVEFGEFNLILSQVEFAGENWLTYARLNLFGEKLIFDRLFVVKEKRIQVKFKRRKGRFIKLPKTYFRDKEYTIE